LILKVQVLENAKTGLLIATCDELPGLWAHGRTEAELEKRIKSGIRLILEAEGRTVSDIHPSDGGGFKPRKIVNYRAEMAA
jgi:predicted RNase H-like HicB family nuclease